MAYWHSVCPVCEQGRLLVVKAPGSGELFLLCEECESAWRTPEEINVMTTYDFGGKRVDRANRGDVESAGWLRYKLTEI